MNDEAGKHIGKGIAWLGFWLMIGLVNFGTGFNLEPKIDSLVQEIKKL